MMKKLAMILVLPVAFLVACNGDDDGSSGGDTVNQGGDSCADSAVNEAYCLNN